MNRRQSRTRYLLSCADEAKLNNLTGLLRRRKGQPTLISSREAAKGLRNGVGVVNKEIRVISVVLTAAELKKVKDARLCKAEKDLFAFSCAAEATTLEAAIKEYPYPWGVKKIDADIVWSSTMGAQVKIAVLDTGIDASHPNLKRNARKGVSFVENVLKPSDDNGHGTHCAGIIAADVADGSEGIYGVAPRAAVYPVKVLNYNGQGQVSAIIAGLDWCLDNRMDIVSMSFRLPSDSKSPALEQACNILWDRGLLLVAAVGNDAEDGRKGRGKVGQVGCPARYNSVIGVGATDKFDTIAPFSNRGDGLDIVAPGVAVLSTYRDRRYRELSGTSQACPHVVGGCCSSEELPKQFNQPAGQASPFRDG